jgi:hypothetical protein
MRILYSFLIFISSGLYALTFSQDITAYRIISVTLNVSQPSGLEINHGRLTWKDKDFGLQTYSLEYYSGAQIFRLDSNMAGFTHSMDGNYIAWNTDKEYIKVFNTNDWSITTIGPSYNPDFLQPVSVAGGQIAYAKKEGNGSVIVLRDIELNHDTVFSEGIWNLQPSLNQGQLAWVQKFLADTSLSNIYFYDGQSTRLLTNTTSTRNHHPLLKDGQVAWLQSDDEYTRVKLFDGDSVITLAEAGAGNLISGYDLSDGIAVAATGNTKTHSTEIKIYNSETGSFVSLQDTALISGLHIDNGLICWSWGSGNIKSLKLYHVDTGELEEWGLAQNPVVDDEQISWTLGDAVDMMVPLSYIKLSAGNENGWPQSRFKDNDGQKVIWGNFDNSTKARLYYSDGNTVMQLTDSLIYKDFVMVNDGHAIWRHDFNTMYLFDGANPPEIIIDSLQCENMYLAGTAIGFHGFKTNAGNTINQAWLYKINTKELIQLSHDDSSNISNKFTLVDGNYACWFRDSANNTMLMLYNGNMVKRITDSAVFPEFGFRKGKIIWSEETQGTYQIMLYDLNTGEKKQITHNSSNSFRPITDGSVAVWFEEDPAGTVMWYYDLAADAARKIARTTPPVARWLWLSNGKVAFSVNGEICLYDGNVISRLTSSAPFNPNEEPFVDDDVIVWNKYNPDPNVNHTGQVFRGKLHAHVAFDAKNITGLAPLQVSFTNHSFQGVRSWKWDFGDGLTSTEKNPMHVFHNPGVYSVTLTVEGLTGNTKEKKINLVRVSQFTSVKEPVIGSPAGFILYQNYPNPCNTNTSISYKLPVQSFISVKVYDLQGREVATLVNEIQPQGMHIVEFSTNAYPPGVYHYVLSTQKFIDSKPLIILR